MSETYGRLTVVGTPETRPIGTQGRKAPFVLCKCECGSQKFYQLWHLRSGHTKSCGCLSREVAIESNTVHGGRDDRLYSIWTNIKTRCLGNNKKCTKNYKDRGITLYPPWRTDYALFREYVSSLPNYGDPSLSIDRIDVNGNYEPGNLRWATDRQQAQNTRKAKRCYWKGKLMLVCDIPRHPDLLMRAVVWRLNAGWSIEDAVSVPPKKHKQKHRKP